MPSRQATLQEDTTFRLLRLLSEQPDLNQRQLAQHLGISLGAVHYCLKALVAKGHIKSQNFAANPNKLHYAYLLTPAGLRAKAELTGSFLSRKLREYEALRQEIESLRQEMAASAALGSANGRGRRWGPRAEKAGEGSPPTQTASRK
jgi:EPS-associated MarR family transcriptional regulator